nr:protein FAR1-related sequence 5 [Tanacetum cinerariifolium]
YAAEAGFVVRPSCQKRLRNDDVKQKYLVCNRKGLPKRIHIDTLDLENSDKQKRNSNLHVTGCKASVVFNLDPHTRKFVLTVFDTIHNHDLEREEFKHLSKRERQLTYLEQAFIVKAASVNICATRAHHLLTDNHKKCVMVVAGLLEKETTKSCIWLLKAFIKAFGKEPSIVVTDQDGAMRNVSKAEFAGSKHRLCMQHITQKLPVKKEIFVGLWHCQIDSKSLVEGSEVCIIKESPYVYEMPEKKKKPESVDKGKDKAEENNTVDLFFKKDRLYKVLRNNANVEMIPQQYILRRWTKNLIHAALRNKRNRYGEKNVVVENFANEETLIVDHYVHLLSKDEPRLGAFVEKLKSLKKEVEADLPKSSFKEQN